jgi:hypothetical protein
VADVQAQSTSDHNHLRDGFLAKTRDEELIAKTRGNLRITLAFRDVSAEVLSAAAKAPSDLARYRAIETTKKQLVQRCEARRKGMRCEVASFYGGSVYRLVETLERILCRHPMGCHIEWGCASRRRYLGTGGWAAQSAWSKQPSAGGDRQAERSAARHHSGVSGV